MSRPRARTRTMLHMPLPVQVCDLGQVEYSATATLQRSLREARSSGAMEDLLLVVQHDPVITAGYRTEYADIAHACTRSIPVVATERGGKATYHGPGQIVVYPIVDLRQHGQDVRAFVRGLEQALIQTLHAFSVPAVRRDEYPGVWVADRKIASIGLRVSRWITMHGLALNVDCDLEPNEWFTPCGIPDVSMTSLARELGAAQCPRLPAVQHLLIEELAAAFELAQHAVSEHSLRDIAKQFPVEDPHLELPSPQPRDLAVLA